MTHIIIGCLWAAAAVAPAAMGGFAVIFFMASRKLSIPLAALSAGAIRLLLTVLFSGIILFFTAVPQGWFLAWLGIFYLITLLAEVYYALSAVGKQKE